MPVWGMYVLLRVLALFSWRGRQRLHIELVTIAMRLVFTLLLPALMRRDIVLALAPGLLMFAFFTPLTVCYFAMS